MAAKRKLSIIKILIVLSIQAGAFVYVFPFYISLMYAFKPREVFAENPLSFPDSLYLGNIKKAMEASNYFNVLKNNIIYVVLTIVLSVVVCSMAGYVLSRNKGRFYSAVYLIILASFMIPFSATMLPIYVNFNNLGLLNTVAGYVILMTGGRIAFNVFMYSGFIKSVPRELEEAAFIDGCGRFRIFWSIIFPLLKPVTSTVAVLTSLVVWNDFMSALIVLQNKELRTLSLSQFYFMSEYTTNLNLAFALFVLGMIPVFLAYLFAQKYMVEGLSAGAVKG